MTMPASRAVKVRLSDRLTRVNVTYPPRWVLFPGDRPNATRSRSRAVTRMAPDITLLRLADRLDRRADANTAEADAIGDPQDVTRGVHQMLATELRTLAADLRAGGGR
jgi:hypothetical protein